MSPDEQNELRQALQKSKKIQKKPSMAPIMRKPAAASGGDVGSSSAGNKNEEFPPKKKRQRKTEEDKAFARRAAPKTEVAHARWKAVRDAYNHYVAPHLKFAAKLQDSVHYNKIQIMTSKK